RSLQERQLLTGLLHAGVQVADDRLAPADDLALELHLETQHAMGGRVLGAHVEDHQLLVGHLVVEDVVVVHDPAVLLVETTAALLGADLLHPLVGGLELGLFRAGDPEIDDAWVAHQTAFGEALNWTGTEPTPKSLRRG